MVITQTPEEMVTLIVEINYRLLGRVRLEEVMLMVGTVATESAFRHRRQIGGGPALGLFQIEPDTAAGIYMSYLRYNPDRYQRMMRICFGLGSAPFFVPEIGDMEELLRLYDDYSACLARLNYLRWPEAIPKSLAGQAAYYKKYHNTVAGKGSVEKYLRDWEAHDCERLVQEVMARWRA